MKYSEIREYILNYIEHCGKEDIVRLYAQVELGKRWRSELTYLDIEWDE